MLSTTVKNVGRYITLSVSLVCQTNGAHCILTHQGEFEALEPHMESVQVMLVYACGAVSRGGVSRDGHASGTGYGNGNASWTGEPKKRVNLITC